METGFHIQSTSDGRVFLQAADGRSIVASATGQLRFSNDQLCFDELSFSLKFINRSVCTLKCDYGCVGYRSKHSRVLECNKANLTLFTLEETKNENGEEHFLHLQGKIERV
jgi:hypothetical protein